MLLYVWYIFVLWPVVTVPVESEDNQDGGDGQKKFKGIKVVNDKQWREVMFTAERIRDQTVSAHGGFCDKSTSC